MSVVQISIASDGRIKAVFEDKDVLILSSTGFLFAYIRYKDGKPVRQTCEFVVSAFAERLCTVLEFRNMHLDSTVWCRALTRRCKQELFSIGYPISFVNWPTTVEEAEQAGLLQRLPDGRTSVQSEDATVRLVLHPHGQRFAVCFPLLVEKPAEGAVGDYRYRWQTQVFASADFPKRWQHPLRLAAEALEFSRGFIEPLAPPREHGETGTTDASVLTCVNTNSEPSSSQDTPLSTDENQSDNAQASMKSVNDGGIHGAAGPTPLTNARQLATGPEAAKRGQIASVRDHTTRLPHPIHSSSESPNFFEERTWWTEWNQEMLPEQEIIQMQWTQEAFMQFIPGNGEVQIWLARDESFVATADGGAFLRHFRGAEDAVLYRASALPVHAWTADGRERYAFAPLAQRALHFRRHAVGILERAAELDCASQAPGSSSAARDDGRAVLSTTVRVRQDVAGVGVFTAFEDGRVRVRFADRTLISIDRWHRSADVLARDGRFFSVSVAAPHGVAEYVQVSMEFAMWAFKSEEEHALAVAASRAVDATLAATRRMTVLCDYSLSGRMGTSDAPRLIEHSSAAARSPAPPPPLPCLRSASSGSMHASVETRPGSSAVSATTQHCAPSHCSGGSPTLHPSHSSSPLLQTRDVRATRDMAAWAAATPAPLSQRTTDASLAHHMQSALSLAPATQEAAQRAAPVLAADLCAGSASSHGSRSYSTPAAQLQTTARTRADAFLPPTTQHLSMRDRDVVVEQWLQQNAAVLARLES